MSHVMTAEEGMLELSMLNAEIKDKNFTDTVVDLLNRNLPPEIVTRLRDLWETTKIIAGEVINIGRIIVEKIVDFCRDNPNLAVGLAVGAAVGSLVGMVPYIGTILMPLSMAIGAVFGVELGRRMDEGKPVDSVLEGAIKLGRKFFELLASILVAVKDYWVAK